MLQVSTKRTATLAILAFLASHDAYADDEETTMGASDTCVKKKPVGSEASSGLTVGDGRPVGPDKLTVPAHIDSVELVDADWGVIPSQYLESWLYNGGGHYVWRRQRSASPGGELDATSVNWTGLDDGGQEVPKARGAGSAVALYTYTIKSSTEKTKKVKRFAEASVAAEAGSQWAGGSANAKVTGSIDTESDFEHSISEKVNITITIKCASYDANAQPNPEPAILYFGPDTVKRELPLPIKDAQGKPKVIKWNPIVVDADFSAENAATNGNAVACWFKYKGEIEKGEVSNTSWGTKKGAGAELGVTNGWRLWKFTADISVQGKASGEWHDLDKTEFSKNALGAWSLNGNSYWLFPAPPTEKQRDDFQKPCKENNDPVACAKWDDIKAGYMAAIMKVKGVDGATEHGPNYRMIEWEAAMLSGSFRKVGDWLDSSTFFELAELQQVGNDCEVWGYRRTVNTNFYDSGALNKQTINGLNMEKCNVVDMGNKIDDSTKVGKIQIGVLTKANTERHSFNWINVPKGGFLSLNNGYDCGHKDWDWTAPSGKYPYWFYANKMMKYFADKYGQQANHYACFGCFKVNGQSCATY